MMTRTRIESNTVMLFISGISWVNTWIACMSGPLPCFGNIEHGRNLAQCNLDSHAGQEPNQHSTGEKICNKTEFQDTRED